jgi:hypothetical protein
VDGIELEIEQRRKLGMPAEVLAMAGLRPGDRVQVQSRRDGRLVIIPMADLVEKYTGAIPGLSAAADLTEQRAE